MSGNLAAVQASIGLQAMSMDELAERTSAYARDIEFSFNRALTDMVGMGEILTHVKQRSEFGKYGNYMRFVESVGVSQRMAQYSVKAFERFQDCPEMLGRIGGVSRLIEVLALPQGEEKAFLEENDVAHMSVRDVRKAVKAATGADEETPHPPKESAQKEREEAQRRENEELRRQIQEQKDKIGALGSLLETANHDLEEANRRSNTLKGLLEDSKAARQQIENDLSALKRQAERGEMEQKQALARMDGAAFTAQVRRFMVECCEVPQMGQAFCDMEHSERTAFVQAVDMLGNFVTSARAALNTVDFEGVYIR